MRWTRQDIADYYTKNEMAYRMWGPNMHYGYWEKGVHSQRRASLRFNEVVAQTVGITSEDAVLDAGCGVGGCSMFLAKTFGCRVTGVTITPRQVEVARRRAERAGVSNLAEFHLMDYHKTSFADKSFSVVWGLESICYAESKAGFIKEAYRVLRDGGRLVIADGYASREEYHGKEQWLMRRWMDGWLVNNLNTPEQCRRFAADAGFRECSYRNVTTHVMPTSRRMLVASLLFLPLHVLDRITPLKPYPTDALFNQYFAMKRGLWEYGILLASK